MKPCGPGAPALLMLCGAVLAACGKSEGGMPGAALEARVNSHRISAQEVEAALKQNPGAALDAPARRAVVNKLIDQRLAMQRALEEHLDRAPHVAQAIEAARSEILARAYLERIAGTHANPTAEQVSHYYAEHPELFSQRRVYSLEEIALTGRPEIGAALRESAAKGQPTEEIAAWLDSRGIRHTVSRGGRSAEQLPLEILPRLHAMKDGEVQVIESAAGSLVVVRLLGSRPAPIDEPSAAPLIRQFLRQRRSSESIAAEMKRLRQQARIEYAAELGGQK